jgi:hypothetical protein
VAFKPEIVKAVLVTAELTATPLTEGAATAMVEHLSAYETPLVLRALARCQLELRGRMALADILDRLEDGHPAPEQAWALVGGLRAGDTVVWTNEVALAYGQVAGILHDRVAARLAFLEGYRQKLAAARLERRPARWWASLGDDPAGRAGALAEAVLMGRLSPESVRAMLPPHEWPQEAMKALPSGGQDMRAELRALVENLADGERRAMIRSARGETPHE